MLEMLLETVLEAVLETVLETLGDWVAVEMVEVGWVGGFWIWRDRV